jgi:TonB-linked SusC/RagA family outer membrane protein
MKLNSIISKSIVLLFIFFSFFYSPQAKAQNALTVTGQVTDDTGKEMTGVTVTLKGTGTSVVTGKDGFYKITVTAGKNTLVFTYVGHIAKEIAINKNSTVVNLSLSPTQAILEDVVVIGYGTQKKGNVSFAVSKLKNENFEERAITRVDQSLVGQLSGVNVKQNTGIPGKAFSIQVRGSGSISGGNEPLYVLDGFPLTPNSSNTGNGSFLANPLDNINPNDIESIEVLKDAAAAAIYGSRASNGVVLITTKRGQIGKPRITLNAYAGYNQAAKKLNMMNGDQWIAQATEVINAQYMATYGASGATVNDNYATRLAKVGSLNANFIPDPRWIQDGHPGLRFIDWQDEIERKGQMQNYELSASGGTDAVRYFLSGNYANQESFIINVGYKTYSLRANLEVNASKRLKFGLNVAPSYSITQDPGIDSKDAIFHQALSLAPVQEDTMSLLVNTGKNGQYLWSSTTNSPFGKLSYNKGTTKRYRTLGSLYGEIQIIKGLTFRSSVNFDNTDNNASTYVPYITAGTLAARTFTGSNNLLAATSGSYSSYRKQTFVNENTLNYTKAFPKFHSNLNVLAGYSYNWDRIDRTQMNSNGGFTSATIQTLNAAAAVTGNTTSSQSVLLSYFGRVQYSYKEKYLLLASVRRDGTSRAGANNKWETFPAASVAWRVSEEKFMKNIPVISDLKLRFSYGINGNIPSADYGSLATLGSFGYPYTTAGIGQAPNSLANPDLKWERSKTYDIGFDFGILKNRITGSFDYYNKLNTDLLLNVPTLAVTGFPTQIGNVGAVRNIGQEIEITSRNLVGKLQWNTSVTFTHNTNKIEALGPGGQTQIIIPNGFTVSDQILRVGSPLNSIYVLKVAGFLTAADVASGSTVPRYGANQQAGDFKFQDANGDGTITEADKQIMGHPNPDYTWGITNTVRYKGFDLTALVQGQWGGSIYSQLGRAISRPGQGRSDNHPASFVNRWYSEASQGEGRFSKAYSIYNNPITAATDWLYSSDYFRVRNITLGYNLKRLLKTQLIQNARIYITMENFFGHDKYYNGLNPDAANTAVSSNGQFPESGDYGGIPLAKSLIFGLNITF